MQSMVQHPDLVLLDYNLSSAPYSKNGIDYLKDMKLVSPESEILMVSSSTDARLIAESISFGANQYIVKDNSGPRVRTGRDKLKL